MTLIRALLVILALAVPSGALAQSTPQLWGQATLDASTTPDVPAGYPYNVGAMAQAASSTEVSLREFIERVIEEKAGRIDDRFKEMDKALKLQADATRMSLENYPTVRDFNDLKGRVDTIVALFQALSALAVIFGVAFSIFKFKTAA